MSNFFASGYVEREDGIEGLCSAVQGLNRLIIIIKIIKSLPISTDKQRFYVPI